MPTIDYVFIDPSEINHELCVISEDEWNRREEQAHRWESDGRCARREISVFDAMMAELHNDRNAEKAKVRNRRKADRKHRLTPKMRKEQEYLRNWNVCMKMVNYGSWDDIPIVEGRVRSKEKHDRADWETDLRGIEYDISYAEMEMENSAEAVRDMTDEINRLDAEYNNAYESLERIEERIKMLIGYQQKTEEHMQNMQEFLRKYNYVKEMM